MAIDSLSFEARAALHRRTILPPPRDKLNPFEKYTVRLRSRTRIDRSQTKTNRTKERAPRGVERHARARDENLSPHGDPERKTGRRLHNESINLC